MNHYRIYHEEILDFLLDYLRLPILERLKQVGMNCGCEYTSFPQFKILKPYSRYDHSLGVALIVWHFTRDKAQTVAGLLHDIATPVFAHVVDFMRGDYLKQEATEAGTETMIADSEALQALLKRDGLATADVCDYHRYPIADNDSPRLSADRLEYTLGNSINYGLCTTDEAKNIYQDILTGFNEDNELELMFAHEVRALAFADAAIRCANIYVSDEDRYAMQMLSELLKYAVKSEAIDEKALYATEPEVIVRLLSDARTATLWQTFRAYSRTVRADQPGPEPGWRRISAKKRCIDPLIHGRGRASDLSKSFSQALSGFQNQRQDYWILGKSHRPGCVGFD